MQLCKIHFKFAKKNFLFLSDQVYPPPSTKPGHPTFVIVQLVPVAVDDVHVQEAEQCAGDQEAVRKGKVFDVARV